MEISEEELQRRQEKLATLKASKFKQQTLPAWRPVPSYGSTMIIFVVFGIIFLTLGISLYVMSDKVQQAQVNYGEDCTTPIGEDCYLTMTLDAGIPGPVYAYYELGNFYQNHRRYV